jgi:transcription antitermination factor NusA-like protein
MKDLIKYIAQALVDHPEAVELSEVEGEQASVIELRVAKDDFGKIIGKQGQWFCNQRLDDRSRMTGDWHVRICRSVAVRFPHATDCMFCGNCRSCQAVNIFA